MPDGHGLFSRCPVCGRVREDGFCHYGACPEGVPAMVHEIECNTCQEHYCSKKDDYLRTVFFSLPSVIRPSCAEHRPNYIKGVAA